MGKVRRRYGNPQPPFFLFFVRQNPLAKSCTFSNLLRVHLEIMICFLYRMMVVHPNEKTKDGETKNGPALTQ